jgi:hypothetical protein
VGATIYYTPGGTAPTAASLVYFGPISLNSATTVQVIATAEIHTASTVASANCKFRTPPGTYAIAVIPTVTAAGSGKSWQLNAISLSLVVNYKHAPTLHSGSTTVAHAVDHARAVVGDK